MKKEKKVFLDTTVFKEDNQSFSKEILNKKRKILILKTIVCSLMLVFICCMMFLPSYKSKAKLISAYDTDNIKWEKTYSYDLMSTITKGVPYLMNYFKEGGNLPEVIDAIKKEENGKTYYLLTIKSDELLKQDVENRRKEQKSSYAKRKNVISWIIFINNKIYNELKDSNMKNEMKKEYADECMEGQKQMIDFFLPEIESGNILGLNAFIYRINKNISEEEFNQYASDYLVGNYEYNEENINKMYELMPNVATYYYTSGSHYTYWEGCFSLALYDTIAGFFLFVLLIISVCFELGLIISLIKTLITKENSKLNLLSEPFRVFPIFVLAFLPIASIVMNITAKADVYTPFALAMQFRFNGYSILGIVAIVCAIGMLVATIIHNQILKKMKEKIDQKINALANGVE